MYDRKWILWPNAPCRTVLFTQAAVKTHKFQAPVNLSVTVPLRERCNCQRGRPDLGPNCTSTLCPLAVLKACLVLYLFNEGSAQLRAESRLSGRKWCVNAARESPETPGIMRKVKSEEFDHLTQAGKGHAKGPDAISFQFLSLSPESDVVIPR